MTTPRDPAHSASVALTTGTHAGTRPGNGKPLRFYQYNGGQPFRPAKG